MKKNESTKQLKAVIYARYSSHSQTEQSIDGQLRVCNEFAEREGYAIVGEYIDRAISGTSAESRPDFQRMIQDAKKHGFEYVIVYKLDRFARNRYDSAVYKHKLKMCGVRVISATENISDNPEGIILEAVLEASAEYYSQELSQKVKRGLRESALKGTFTGGTPPLGYKVDGKRVIIDEEKAPVIRYAFEEYAKGKPKKQIVDELNAKGIRSSKGKLFSINSFQHCLKNRKYIGYVTYGGIEYSNTYPPLIDSDIFEKVQERLKKMAHAPASSKARQEYLLQGKAFCGICGTRMVGDAGTSKTGAMYFYYSCGAKKKAHTCKKKSEKKAFLEWYVVEQTLTYLLTPDRMEYIAERVVEEYDKEFNDTRIKEYEKRIDKLDRDADKTFKLIMDSEISAVIKRYEKQIELLELQKNDLEIDLSKLRIANGIRYTKNEIMAWLKQFTKGDLKDEVFRRRIIDVFINSVYVYDDKVVIYYNIKNGKQISYIENCDALDRSVAENEETSGFNGVRISNRAPRQNVWSIKMHPLQSQCSCGFVGGADHFSKVSVCEMQTPCFYRLTRVERAYYHKASIGQLFGRYLAGDSFGKIAAGLEKTGIPSPTGKAKWNREAISKLLSNEKYVGSVLLQKTMSFVGMQIKNEGQLDKVLIQNHHAAIISVEDFQRVQEMKMKRSKAQTQEISMTMSY